VVLAKLDRYLVAKLPRGEMLAMAEHIEICIVCAEGLVLATNDLS
jgi:hypothetical protein